MLSKQVANSRATKSRKVPLRANSNVNKTYDTRVATAQYGDRNRETTENEKYFQKMEAVRREKRNKYEQAVFKKLENIDMNPHDWHKEEMRRLAARRDDNLSEEDSVASAAGLEDFLIGRIIGQGAYAVVRMGLHKPSDK